VLVSDQEFKTGIWGPTPVVHCWRHIIGDVGYYLQKHQKPIEDQNTAKKNVKTLLMCRTPQEYEKKLVDFLQKKEGPWRHQEFRHYFNKKTSPVIQQSAAYWNLKNLNMANIENGMTNNAAEGANSALKAWTATQNRITEGKLGKKTRTELYETIAACKSYSDNENAKILMAHYKRSPEYKFKKEYKALELNPDDMPRIRQVDIVEDIRYLNGIMQTNTTDDDVRLAKDEQEKKHEERSKGLKFAAADLVKTSRVFQETTKGVYYCMDKNKEPFFLDVKTNRCSCDRQGWCAHLVAARKLAGITDDYEVPTQTARGKRIPAPKHPFQKRRESASSKRPKPQDFDNKEKATRKEEEDMDVEGFFDDQSADKQEEAKKRAAMRKAREEAAATAAQFAFMNKHKLRFDLNDHEYERNRAVHEAKAITPTPAQEEEIRQQELAALRLEDRNQVKYAKYHFDKDNFDRNSSRYAIGSRDSFHSAGYDYGFYVHSDHEIVMTAKTFDPKAAIYAARSIQHLENHKGYTMVGFLKSEDPGQEFITMDANMPGMEWHEMVTVCHCRDPCFVKKVDELRECNGCKEKYHFECLPDNVPKDREERWDCGLCTVPITGLQWGAGGIRNTCPIDNAVTSLTVKCMENKAFETKLKRFKYPSDVAYPDNKVSKAMQETINATKAGNSEKAHTVWNKLRISRDPAISIKKVNDMYGTPRAMFYHLIEDATKVERITSCDNCSYVEQRLQEADIAPPTKGRLDREIWNSITDDGMSTRCPKCRVGACRKRGYSVDPFTPPIMIRFETEFNGTTLQEAMWAPKEIDVPGGHTYEMAHITMQRPGHFHAVITHNQQFLHYDGLRHERFQRINETMKYNLCSENNVNDICYTWKEKTPAGKKLNPDMYSTNSESSESREPSDSSDSDFVPKKVQRHRTTTGTKKTKEAVQESNLDNEEAGPSKETDTKTKTKTAAKDNRDFKNDDKTKQAYIEEITLDSDSGDSSGFFPSSAFVPTEKSKSKPKPTPTTIIRNTKETVRTAKIVRTSTPTDEPIDNEGIPSRDISPNLSTKSDDSDNLDVTRTKIPTAPRQRHHEKVVKPSTSRDAQHVHQPDEMQSTSSQQKKDKHERQQRRHPSTQTTLQTGIVDYSDSDDNMDEGDNLDTITHSKQETTLKQPSEKPRNPLLRPGPKSAKLKHAIKKHEAAFEKVEDYKLWLKWFKNNS
jgi:hypothetical protein